MSTVEPKRSRPIQERFQLRVKHAVTTRKVFPFLAGTTASLAIVAGAIMRVANPDEFKTLGDGVWWALVTLATVGYGDFVPTNTLGKFIGSGVILLGVTFLAFLTATVTSMFVSTDQQAESERISNEARAYAERNGEALARIEKRLDAIEAKLGIPPGGDARPQ